VAQDASRRLIGTRSGLASRVRVYLTPEALEIEDLEGYDVTRKRVFFDDVLLVTYHRFVGIGWMVSMGVLLGFAGLLCLALFAAADRTAGLVAFLCLPLPLLVLLVLRLALRVDAVTVYGRRTRAQVHFWFRKRKARAVFQQVCRLARERQAREARAVG
jgi:hypothetical protein